MFATHILSCTPVRCSCNCDTRCGKATYSHCDKCLLCDVTFCRFINLLLLITGLDLIVAVIYCRMFAKGI